MRMTENSNQFESSGQRQRETSFNRSQTCSTESDTFEFLGRHAVARTRKEETFYNSIDLAPPFFFSC